MSLSRPREFSGFFSHRIEILPLTVFSMNKPVARIDHLVAVVENFAAGRRAWLEAGCPLVYDGAMPTHRACCISLGPINLELLSAEAFDGWPALAQRSARAGRRFGLQAVALDPGDLDATVAALRARRLVVSEPLDGQLIAAGGAPPAARWRNSYLDGLDGLLPGLPSFLCEFVSPARHLGRAWPDSPIELVELRVGRPDPAATARAWQHILNLPAVRDGASSLLPLADTPIRLVPGAELTLVVRQRLDGLPIDRLEAVVPGVHFVRVEADRP